MFIAMVFVNYGVPKDGKKTVSELRGRALEEES
jgi:hypothetical protein